MTVPARLFLIGGVPRSGTTLLIQWLRDAWPGDKIWCTESGLTNLAYHTYRLYDFNAKNHPSGINFSHNGTQRDEALRELRRWITALYRLKSGNHTAPWILDKMPVFFQGGERYYHAMGDIFPEVKLVFLIRHFRDVIPSMRQRTWARGPFPKLNYMSPFVEDAIAADCLDTYVCDSERVGTQPTSYLSESGTWSFQKCCRNYAHAIRGIAKIMETHGDWLVVDYERLTDPEPIRSRLSSYTGVQLGTPFAFQPRRRDIVFTDDEEQTILEELERNGVRATYEQLQARSV